MVDAELKTEVKDDIIAAIITAIIKPLKPKIICLSLISNFFVVKFLKKIQAIIYLFFI